jgi:hypothetical protein
MYCLASMTQFKGASLLNFHAAFAGLGVLARRELSSIIQLFSVLICRLQTKSKQKDREPPDECGWHAVCTKRSNKLRKN